MKLQYFKTVLFALLFFVFALTGCATATYKSNLPANLPRLAGYPISMYTQDQKVPRPYEVMGTVSVGAGKITMFGGSLEDELKQVRRYAHEKGADAIKFGDVEKPDFANPNYRLTAELLRYSDVWETVPMSREKFQAYLAANRRQTDPIEGIWNSGGLDGLTPHTIGIIKNTSKQGRDFIAFMLDSQNPVWPAGMKKMDIRRGLAPGSYILIYYLDDFAHREIPIILGQRRTFKIDVQKDEEDNFITYVKE